MPTKVPIEVFRIGRTVVDKEEVDRWMKHIGATDFVFPEDEEVTNPALLIALAGKRCYMSFQPGLNKNVTRVRKEYVDYFDNILASAHGSVLEHSVYNFAIEGVSRVFCYHPDTELLTQAGWKPVAEVADDEVLLTLDPQTGSARWSKNHKQHQFEYSGPLYYWQNREDLSPMVTPDHTMWCCPADIRRVRGLRAMDAMRQCGRKEKFSDLLGKKFFVQNAIGEIAGVEDPDTVAIGDFTYSADKLFTWLGWVATDGTIVKDETGRSRVRVNQSKPQGVATLRRVCRSVFGDRCKETGDHYKAFDVSDPALRRWCVSMIGRTNKDRNILPLLRYSPRLVAAFLDGAKGGDGIHGANNHVGISCGGNTRVAAQYQALIAVTGLASRVSVRTDEIGKCREVNGALLTNTLPAVTVEIHQRGSGACMVKAKHQRVVHYNGLVYCPQTDDGIVYARVPGGKALWCGNTAEMNRHRAGWAISEGSLRFIRFGENVPYWEPDSIKGEDVQDRTTLLDDIERMVKCAIAGDKQSLEVKAQFYRGNIEAKKQVSRELFRRAFRNQEIEYGVLEAVWADELAPESKFAGKKQVTSMMRRIIGLGVATGGVWSGNIRGLRHVFTMRAAEAAEEEMIHVFSRVVKVMVEKEPLLFGDFTIDQNGFYRPKYYKV